MKKHTPLTYISTDRTLTGLSIVLYHKHNHLANNDYSCIQTHPHLHKETHTCTSQSPTAHSNMYYNYRIYQYSQKLSLTIQVISKIYNTHVYMHTCMCTHVCMHASTHTHTHTHTHTQRRKLSKGYHPSERHFNNICFSNLHMYHSDSYVLCVCSDRNWEQAKAVLS